MVAPTYSGATINPAAAGNGICDLAFSEAITSATADYESGFTVGCRQPAGTWLNLDATKYTMVLSGTTKIRLTLTGTVNTWQASHELRVSYNSAVGNIKDLAGNALASFTNNATLTNSSTIDLLASLTERWSFNEASGTRVASITTPGNDLSDNNTVTQATYASPPGLSPAAQFTAATAEWLSLADNGNFDFTTLMTVALWLYLDSNPGYMGIVTKWDFQTDGCWILQTESTPKLSIAVADAAADGGGNNGAGGTTLSTGTWYHVVFVYDGTQTGNANRAKVYLNAAQETLTFSGTIAASLLNSAAALRFGRWGGTLTRHWSGRQDEGSLSSKAWTAAEITDHYNGGTGKSYPYVPDNA